MVQVQVPGTCLLCGLNTKFLSSHFAQTHSTHSFFPRGARCPCGHVASVLELRKHQDATPLCRLKYRDDATPPPREVPPTSKVVVELPSPRTAGWRQQYWHANALLRKREREAIETVTARELPLEQGRRQQQRHFRARDPTQYSRTAAYVLLDDTYGSQPKRTPSEASTYTPSGDERRFSNSDSGSTSSGSESSAVDSDPSPSARRRARDNKTVHAPRRSTSTGRRPSPLRRKAANAFSDDSDPPFDEYDYDVNVTAAIDDAGAASDGPEVINLVDSTDEEGDGRRRPILTPPVHSSQPAASSSTRPAKNDVDEYCTMCMKVYGTSKELYMHMNKVHDRMHISEDDFTSKKLVACPCGRVCSLRGLVRHRELTCTLSEAARTRDAVSGLEAKRRAMLGLPAAGARGASTTGGGSNKKAPSTAPGKVHRSASGNRLYRGTCNICNVFVEDLYWHMREHNREGRHLVPADVTAEDIEVCRCGKIRGLTLMAQVMHDKSCPYGKDRRRTLSSVSARPAPAPASGTAPVKHVGRCNICKREVSDVYQHLRNHNDRRLKPKHLTCDTMVICRCGKPKGLTEIALRMHDSKGCPYADQRLSTSTSLISKPEGGALPRPADDTPRYPGGNKKYPGSCNICNKDCSDLYMHLRDHPGPFKPGDITCDTLVICRCGKTKSLTKMGITMHNLHCKYAGRDDPAPAPVPVPAPAAPAAPRATAPAAAEDVEPGPWNNWKRKYPGRCNICRKDITDLYNHMRGHTERRLRPDDMTCDSLVICKCGKTKGVTPHAEDIHNKRCKYAIPRSPASSTRPIPAPTVPTVTEAVAPANDARGGTCNICRRTVKWLYNHVADNHANDFLRPGDITADTWMVCKCGKMHGVTEGAIRKHAFSCRYAWSSLAAKPSVGSSAKRPREPDAVPDAERSKRRKYASGDDEGSSSHVRGADSILQSPATPVLNDDQEDIDGVDEKDSDSELASIRERAKGKRRARDTMSEAEESVDSDEALGLALDMDPEEFAVFKFDSRRHSRSRRSRVDSSGDEGSLDGVEDEDDDNELPRLKERGATKRPIAIGPESGIEDVDDDEEDWPEPSPRSSRRKHRVQQTDDEDDKPTPSRIERRISRLRDTDSDEGFAHTEGSEEEGRPARKRLSKDTVDLLMKRRKYRAEQSDSPDGPVEGGDYRPMNKKSKKSKPTARKSSRNRAWEAEYEHSRSASVRDTPVPEQVSPRKRVASRTPAFSVSDSEEPSAPAPSAQDILVPASVPSTSATTQPESRRRSGPSWAAHNSPPADAEEDAEEAEEILTTQSTVPSPHIQRKPKNSSGPDNNFRVIVHVNPQSSSQRMRLSGIDLPARPKNKEKKRPRHSVPA